MSKRKSGSILMMLVLFVLVLGITGALPAVASNKDRKVPSQRAEMLKLKEYEALSVSAQKVYITELREVMVHLESLGGQTQLLAQDERIKDAQIAKLIGKEASNRVPSSLADSPEGMSVKVGNNIVPCQKTDKPCIFAGNLSCRKEGKCRIPVAATDERNCQDGVLCHEFFGLTAEAKRICVTRDESAGFQNISRVCLDKSIEISNSTKKENTVLYSSDYERHAKAAEKIWEINCWDGNKAKPDRDRVACEAVSVGMYKAKKKALEMQGVAEKISPSRAQPAISEQGK